MRLPSDPRQYIVGVLVAAVVVFAAYSFASVPGSVSGGGLPTSFSVYGRTFPITYTATTPAQRAQGLMGTRVTSTTTMLFVFPSPGYYSFWMFDTNTSLDMVWISATGSSGTVVYLVQDAASCKLPALFCARYTPSTEANYVLEAKAGFAAANGITVGTTISFS